MVAVLDEAARFNQLSELVVLRPVMAQRSIVTLGCPFRTLTFLVVDVSFVIQQLLADNLEFPWIEAFDDGISFFLDIPLVDQRMRFDATLVETKIYGFDPIGELALRPFTFLAVTDQEFGHQINLSELRPTGPKCIGLPPSFHGCQYLGR